MFLVVGLGNPGDDYNKTRHNIGFEVIDKLAEMYKINVNRSKFKGVYGDFRSGSEKIILLKPTTYMNLSGESVIEAAEYFNIPNEKIIVIHDDVSLDAGRLRIREKGSSGGQNGVKNIIHHLGTQEFNRIKVGVGKPKGNLVSHVLGKFPKEEQEIMEKSIEAACHAVECMIKHDVNKAMNQFNGFNAVVVDK